MLALGTGAQTIVCSLLFGLPFLLPYLRRTEGVDLAAGGAFVAAPSLGLFLTLVAWGAFADRYGERLAIALGLALTGLTGLGAAAAGGLGTRAVLLVLVGAAGASVNSASGRLVMGWFAPRQRGVAMGIRQMGQPLGVALGAAALPPLAQRGGLELALGVPAVGCLAVMLLVAVFAEDPPHPVTSTAGAGTAAGAAGGVSGKVPSPYRTTQLWRVHVASALRVVPQFTTASFSAEFLVSERGWDAQTAGRVLAVVALGGAAGRLVAGRWSDLAGSRLRPMRIIAVASAVAMLGVALTESTTGALVVLALAVASIVSVSDNGLGFTATAEIAGRAWSGRSLGLQNTVQNLAAFATAPVVGAMAGAWGYAWAFGLVAVFPLVGARVTPVQADRVLADRLAARQHAEDEATGEAAGEAAG
jgi:MFS family permease